jgi:hypothetical protein
MNKYAVVVVMINIINIISIISIIIDIIKNELTSRWIESTLPLSGQLLRRLRLFGRVVWSLNGPF